MELTKWEPLHELTSMRRQMERLWESFFGGESKDFYNEGFTTCLDVAENKDEVLVKVDVPGIDEKDFSVSLSGRRSSILLTGFLEVQYRASCLQPFLSSLSFPIVPADPSLMKQLTRNSLFF